MDVTVADATSSGGETARLLLQGLPSSLTLRELIRIRVREEVARHNANPGQRFSRLVRPLDAEAELNRYGSRERARLDWEAQAETALRAFERNGFFVFAGGRQVDDLDEELALADQDVVSFVRLVPLAGG
jgi:anti-sigma factor RsiW